MKRRDEEARQDARQREAEAREQVREARQRDLCLTPHYEELSPSDRRLFRRLRDLASFSVEEVARIIGGSREDAWEALAPLLRANCLIERLGPFGEVRPYSASQPYWVTASVENVFSTYMYLHNAFRDEEIIDLWVKSGTSDDGKPVFMPPPDAPATSIASPYRPDQRQMLEPRPPVPYSTFDETFEY